MPQAGCAPPATTGVKPHVLRSGDLLAAGPTGGTWLDLELIIASIEVFLLWCFLRCRGSAPTRGPASLPPSLALTPHCPWPSHPAGQWPLDQVGVEGQRSHMLCDLIASRRFQDGPRTTHVTQLQPVRHRASLLMGLLGKTFFPAKIPVH